MVKVFKASTAADEVTLYDNGQPVGTATVVDGKWSANLAGLSVGQHSLEAKISDRTSARRSFEVRLPWLDFTNFQDGTWGGWEQYTGPGIKEYVLGAEGTNRYGVIRYITTYGYTTLTLRKTVHGFVVGKRYRFEASVRITASPKFHAAMESPISSVRITGPNDRWGSAGINFTATSSSHQLDVWIYATQPVDPGMELWMDNIGILPLD